MDASDKSLGFPKRAIASPLLFGFKFMLIFERIMHARTSDSHTHNGTHSPLPTEEPPVEPPRSARRMPAGAGGNGHVEFDVELGELEEAEGMGVQEEERERRHPPAYEPQSDPEGKRKAYPVTLGLIVHALADGLALGSSAFTNDSTSTSGLSFLIFAALVVHKGELS